MKEAEYYYTFSKSGFIEFARQLSNAAGQTVSIVDNKLKFPASFATGTIAFYELNEGIGVALADCVFHNNIKLKLQVIKGSDNYKIIFNVNNQPLQIIDKAGEKLLIGNNFGDAVFFNSGSVASEIWIEGGQPVKMVQLFVNRNWIVQNLLQNEVPLRSSRLKQFMSYEGIQFSTSMDLKSYEFANQMFTEKAPGRLLPSILEGYAFQLMALLINNMVEDEMSEEQEIPQDLLRIMQLKEQIEHNLEDELPSLDEAASICLMSRTRFIETFKTLYKKSYGNFFLDVKMKRAKVLLSQGCPVTEVSYKTGYGNVSHFVKVFKTYFGITPGNYQSGIEQVLIKHKK